MISNERQYRSAVRQRRALIEALDELVGENSTLLSPPPVEHNDDQLILRFQIEEAALSGQISDLNHKIQDYEALRAGTRSTIRVSSFAELPEALVRARIASGLTQRELAERLGIKEQQVQRYETDLYASASLSRLRETINALGVELTADLNLPDSEVPIARLRRRLTKLGLDRRVVNQRLLRGISDALEPTKFLEIAERSARLLAISLQQLLSDDPLPALATTARFKAPKNAAHLPLDAYTRYAESIADIVFRATEHLGPPSPPSSGIEARAGIEQAARDLAPSIEDPLKRSDLLLTATLAYLADLRIPVVALRDPGAFYGACFTRNGRSVIVLKQTTDSAAQWVTGLLHELDHVRDPNRNELRGWVELGDIGEWSNAPEEHHANDFAADVLFSGRVESVLSLCLYEAQGSVERLKSVIPSVAEQAEVPIDILASQLAFRLSARGINWWATAATMQEHGMPWQQVNDQLLQQLDMRSIDALDRAALLDVLAG
jgi:transcriptional regulator with XRE-family HTH domain